MSCTFSLIVVFKQGKTFDLVKTEMLRSNIFSIALKVNDWLSWFVSIILAASTYYDGLRGWMTKGSVKDDTE